MNELPAEAVSWLASGERVAMATVIRVAGSAPRGVGAKLVVSAGGRLAGSVSGGCVETTVYGELMDLLAGGPARRLQFSITEDMIWDVGLACGGTIDLILHELDAGLIAALDELVHEAKPCVLATVVTGDELGVSAVLGPEGRIAGLDHPDLARAAQEMLASRSEVGEIRQVAPGLEALLEPFLPPPRLVIVGAVHIAIPLTRLAKELGFRVTVVDPRARFANRERFPEADELFVEWPDEAFAHLAVDDRTFVALLTHDPKIDEPTLAAALETEARYIGAIGSRGTHAARFERMARLGVTAEQLGRVYGPIGLDLGGRTPAETALSILAEVVAVKNSRPGGHLRQTGP